MGPVIWVPLGEARGVFERLCGSPHLCIDLDKALDTNRSAYLIQSDVHWNAEEHKRVAEVIEGFLRARLGSRCGEAGKPQWLRFRSVTIPAQ